MEYSLEALEKRYNLELEKVIVSIKRQKAKLVLLQFPEGLKPYATAIVDELRKKTDSEFLIWVGSCFGACDLPVGLEKIKPQIDLVIQFGHNEMVPSFK